MRVVHGSRPAVGAFALLALAVVIVAWALCACGRVPESGGERTSEASSDTLRIDVAGREIVVPPPQGMVEVSRRLHQDIPPRRDRVVGLFVPAAELEAVRKGGVSRFYVFATVPAVNRANEVENAARFDTVRAQTLEFAARSADDSTRRIAAALASWRTGEEREIPDPLAARSGDPVMVLAEPIDPQAFQHVAVRHPTAAEGGGCELHTAVRVLVRGRILELMWTQQEPFSVRALAEARASAADWSSAILAANR